ncbi:MAG TPA: hypothetical protein GXX70_03325 [Tepidimicrobium sp.]|nr:hypothetical protein [Tepidimicrobium sp.]
MKNNDIFNKDFIPYIIKNGRLLSLLGMLLSFGPGIALALQGIFPPMDALLAAVSIRLPMVAHLYITEPISYFAVLGIPGTYMSFLSGNISNLRLPCGSVAQESAGVQEGTDEGTIIATIGVAVSTFVNITVLAIGVVGGTYITSILPAKVLEGINLLIPALFASLAANYIRQNPKVALIGVPLAFAMTILGMGPLQVLPSALANSLPILVTVFGTMGAGIALAKKGKI